MSLSHVLAAADSVRDQIVGGANDPKNFASTPAEIRAGHIARQETIGALHSSIAMVENTLGLLQTTASPNPSSASQKAQSVSLKAQSASLKANKTQGTPLAKTASVAAEGPQKVLDGMRANSMKTSQHSLQDMAKTIQPIVTKFDSILTAPYLNQYSATLNTVPVVGIKNNQLMYIQTKQQSLPHGGGTVDIWSTFSSLPPGVTIKSSDVVHIFPYKGDFCLAIGKTVYRKVHLNEKDPAIQSAVDNWPALYSQDWTTLGDCLHAANLTSVVPFAVLSADRTQIAFQLVTLSPDGSLTWLTSDQLTSESKWEKLRYRASSNGPPTSPKFVKIAYWNNNIVGIDDASNTWNIAPSFQNGTYTVADQYKIEPVTEFTATDAGPVGLRSDGYLWKRIIAPSPDGDKNKDPVLEWARWIRVDGVVNIGVASPGVVLNMNLLTRTLKSRYIDVQTAVYPVVEKIRAWCTTHVILLNKLIKDADTYVNSDDEDKRTLAVKDAKAFINHAKVWGKIVSRSVGSCQESVNVMTAQLHDVRLQLEAQLKLLHTKLSMLQSTLEAQEEAMSKLKAAFWGSIAAGILGIAILAIGAFTANPYVLAAGGALLIGGIVAASVLGSKISSLAADIATTRSQIATVNTAIVEMTNIVNAFSELDAMYGTLNQFWGRLNNDASNVKTMDDATAELIGEEILEDTSSIEASIEVATLMGDACQTYLDVLNRQGVIIPDTASKIALFATPDPSSPAAKAFKGSSSPVLEDSFDPILDAAQQALIDGDLDKYDAMMQHASRVQLKATANQAFAKASSGSWFDVQKLHSASNVWLSLSQPFSKTAGLLDSDEAFDGHPGGILAKGSALDADLARVKPDVINALECIKSMASLIVDWVKQFPEAPTEDEEIGKMEEQRDNAVKYCESGQRKAASANNGFAEFNRKATAYQQDLERQVNSKKGDINAANSQYDYDMNHISVPWTVGIGGPLYPLTYIDRERSKIRSRRDDTIRSIDREVERLKNLQLTGASFNGNVMTWQEMSQSVNAHLGTIHNLLVGIWGQLMEDPVLYAEFVQGGWSDLVKNADEVLAILRTQNKIQMKTTLLINSATALQVVKAVSPSTSLGTGIASQARSATSFMDSLDILLQLPFTKDIIGYWDVEKTQSRSLYDITVSLRTEYINMLATEYHAVEVLQQLALLQDHRARNVVSGKLSLQSFVKSTLVSISTALKSTNHTVDKFKDAAKDFEIILTVINDNIAAIEEKITDLSDKIEDLETAQRDKITTIIADTIALAFTSAVLLTTLGMLGPVTAVVALEVQIGAGAALIGVGIKTVLDALSLSDLIKVIQTLKATRKTLKESVEGLHQIQPSFVSVVAGVKELNGVVADMKKALINVQRDVEFGVNISLTREDAEGIQAAWAKVREDTQTWLDVVNRQGIVPAWAFD